MPRGDRYELDGVIASAGFASGDRIVVGHWTSSPVGPVTDVMWARPGGERVLLVPSEAAGRFISAVYRFERVEVVPVRARVDPRRVDLVAGDLELKLRTRWGVGLPVRRPAWFTRGVEAPFALALLGVHTYGTSPSGVREWYRASSWRPVSDGWAGVAGRDLGPTAPLHPPLGVGFSEPPGRPSIVGVRPLLVDPGGGVAEALRLAPGDLIPDPGVPVVGG